MDTICAPPGPTSARMGSSDAYPAAQHHCWPEWVPSCTALSRRQGRSMRSNAAQATNARRADRPGAARLARSAAKPDSTRHGHGQGDRLQLEPLERTHALPGRRRIADRQQPGRATDPPLGDGPEELAVRGNVDGGQASRGDHEPDPVGQAQWSRSLCLPQGRADKTSNSQGQCDRRFAAASMGAGALRIGQSGGVNMSSLHAHRAVAARFGAVGRRLSQSAPNDAI